MNWFRRLTPPRQSTENRETSLVEAARRGDRRAFDALRRAHEPTLRGFLGRRVGPEALDDVLQETWLAGWEALPGLSRRTHFKAWLFAIAQHKCADHHRRYRRSSLETPLREDLPAGSDSAFADAELRETVRALLAQLPAVQREVLEMYYYDELTLAEIAGVLERSLNTVKYQFYRAHAQVAQGLSALRLLEQEGFLDRRRGGKT